MVEFSMGFRFDIDQQIFEIGGVRVGGQPGELPTVLIGSIFHHGHRIVEDPRKGVFDRVRAEELIRRQDDLSRETGNPCMIDLVGETGEAIRRYISFVADLTHTPILINAPTPAVRIEGVRFAGEIGILDRVIYNSVNFTIREEEVEAIRDVGVKAALVQAFNPKNPWPQAMIDVLKGGESGEGLLSITSRAGIEKTLILTPVLDIPHIGCSVAGIWRVKKELGLPAGTAPVGVMGSWGKIDRYGPHAKAVARAVAAVLAQSMGADFIIYGSMAKAETIFPACALIDSMIAYNGRNYGVRPLVRDHPLYKIFKP